MKKRRRSEEPSATRHRTHADRSDQHGKGGKGAPSRKRPPATTLQGMYVREEIEQLRPLLEDLFAHMDSDGDGFVDREALEFALYVNGCVYEAKKELIMQIVDADYPSGRYDLSTFCDILMSEIASRTVDEESERAFKLFTRYAGESDESQILSRPVQDEVILPEDLKELDDMIKEFGSSGKGVTFAEFCSIISAPKK